MKKLLILGLALVSFSGADLLADKYKFCEVEGISIVAGQSGKTGNLSCYSGENVTQWIGCGEKKGEFQTPKSYPTPRISEEGIASASSDCDTTSLNDEIYRLQQVSYNELCGFCSSHPKMARVEVTNVDENLTFYYMALKDRAVLANVDINDGTLTAGSLVRNDRISMMSRQATSRSQKVSTIGYAKGEASMATSQVRDMPGEDRSAEISSEEVAAKICQNKKENLGYVISNLKQKIERQKSLRDNCASGVVSPKALPK